MKYSKCFRAVSFKMLCGRKTIQNSGRGVNDKYGNRMKLKYNFVERGVLGIQNAGEE